MENSSASYFDVVIGAALDGDSLLPQWLYQPGYPPLASELRVDSATRTASLRVRQAQPVAWGRFR